MEEVFGREELNQPIDIERLNNLFGSEQKHKEQKDEMKNRISMALKDPILQQGFEIICKNLSELEKRLSVLLSCKNCPDNKGGFICQKEYEDKCLAQKIQYIKELKEENAELNKKLSNAEADYDKMFWNKNEIISKAKEIIKMLHSDCYSIAECEDTNIGLWEDDLAKAEQFLKEE